MTTRLLLILVAALALPTGAAAQRALQFSAAVGPYRVDDLAGTPLVPSVALAKPFGRRAVWNATLGLVREAGFYGLDALTLDVGVGLRGRPTRFEWQATIGPSALVGGDGDGTPYTTAGVHTTVAGIWWAGKRVGLLASATGRVWATTGNSRFSPSARLGLVIGR